MVHQLCIVTDSTTLPLDFTEDLEPQIHNLLGQVSGLPPLWSTTRYETDLASLTWSTGGSRDQVIAVLEGCRQHGWPFVAYVQARVNDDPSTWLADYAATYLGWWADRRAFAQEIAAAGAHFIEDENATEGLDPGTIDEICSGFLCIEVDGQVVIFDVVLDGEESL